MRVVLRRLEVLGGLAVAADETHELDRVTLGRGTDQAVQLPDMRVTLAHAEIRLQPGGGYRVECLGDNPVWVNGSAETDAALGTGDTIDLGRFRLTIGVPEPGDDLLLEIEERGGAREEKGRQRGAYKMTLEQGGLRKRRWALGSATFLLLTLLVLPIVLRFGSGDGRSLDAAWISGPPSAAHAGFIGSCNRCHATPFAAVKNEACLACHKAQPHHSDRADMLALAGMGDARCGSCHQEHTGRNGLVARSPELCTTCHADPAGLSMAGGGLMPVHRFGGDHPPFSLSLATLKDGKAAFHEARQDEGATLHEDSGLIFPHDVHLAAKGIASPTGNRVMACADCHVPSATGFVPVRMAEACVSCHQLDFDPDRPGRRLPHGQPDEVVSVIRDHYARTALAGGVKEPTAPEAVRLIRRPGEVLTLAQSQAALEWADAQAERTLEDVFTRRVCAECHTVTHSGDAAHPWVVTPVRLNTTYLLGARFDHRAHASEQCSRCHQANASKLSSDVMLPGIASCRECHSDPGTLNRMGSACVDCHGFHTAKHALFGEPAK